MGVWKEGLNLVNTPTSESLKWRTYFNIAHDYSVRIPTDWEIYDTDESHVSAFSPDTSPFVTIFVPDAVTESPEDRLQSYTEFMRSTSHIDFELLQQHVRTESNGDQIGYIHFRYQISKESCLEHFREYLLVTRSMSYWLRARTCEDGLENYSHVVDHFFDSLTLLR